VPSRWFRIAYAENAFRRFAVARGTDPATLHAPEAVSLALAFYREMRAQHARIQDQGDALLWQWGPDADAQAFTVDLTRQLVREDRDDITQLALTLRYRWTPVRRRLGRGHAWCFSPAESTAFERELRASPAYRAITTAVPSGVLLRTEVL